MSVDNHDGLLHESVIGDDPTVSLGLPFQNLIDELCDEFEDSWKRGATPDINHYLERTQSDVRPALLVELVRVDMEYQSLSGNAPSPEEYARRFPQYKHHLAHLRSFRSHAVETILKLRQIGGLKLIQKIGVGAFGHVWKAWDPQLEREVAVKLPTDRSLSREYEDEFRREAKAAAKLGHPGIVRVINYGEENGIAYIVYDLVNGRSLRHWIRRNTIPVNKVAQVCADIADALSHAHEQGVVHRDLKPGNILMDADDNPHITDFGLAKRRDSTSTIAGTGIVIGTLAYMSPEQAEGKSGLIDGGTDLYALGVILYEMLSGKSLFEGNAREILHKILHAPPPALSSLVPDIPSDLETICHKCLEKQRADRYPTARELADDLNRFVRGEAVQARPLPHRVRAWRWAMKHWLTIGAGLAIAVLTAVLFNKPEQPSTKNAVIAVPAVHATWNVLITTSPTGAHVRVIPRDPATGDLVLDRQVIRLDLTPIRLDLPPGQYQVETVLPNDPKRSHQVLRTVPQAGTDSPTGAGNWREFRIIGPQKLEWPEIIIPDGDITKQMVYFEGTDSFPVGDQAVGKTVRIEPFYVFPREFTFGDFLKIRPGSAGNVPGKPATQQPPDNALAERGDLAEHWAEEFGGRLLTEIEFEYLAVMAARAEKDRAVDPDDDLSFEIAGGSRRDEIPSDPPIRGILSGYAEWTLSRPNQLHIWPPIKLSVPADYLIVRGGTPLTGPGEFGRDPYQRTAVAHYEFHPTIGFRVARSANRIPLTTE